MPLSPEQHLDNLVRHIDLVRSACLLLGKRLIASGRNEFGTILISRGFQHDVSKFSGIEWDFLHAGKDIPKAKLDLAIRQHILTNDHHPEYWGGIDNMPEICIAEMICDWYARSQEFGSSVRDWIDKQAVPRYNIDLNGKQYQRIINFLDILLESSFV